MFWAGGLAKDHTFPVLFFDPFPKLKHGHIVLIQAIWPHSVTPSIGTPPNLTAEEIEEIIEKDLWRFGHTGALIFTHKWLNRAKTEVLCGTLKIFPRPGQGFLGCKGHNWPGSIEKSKIYHLVWSHEGSTFFKKGPHLGQNSRPGESDPYMS